VFPPRAYRARTWKKPKENHRSNPREGKSKESLKSSRRCQVLSKDRRTNLRRPKKKNAEKAQRESVGNSGRGIFTLLTEQQERRGKTKRKSGGYEKEQGNKRGEGTCRPDLPLQHLKGMRNGKEHPRSRLSRSFGSFPVQRGRKKQTSLLHLDKEKKKEEVKATLESGAMGITKTRGRKTLDYYAFIKKN